MDLKIKGFAPTFFTRVAFGDCRASAGFYNLKSLLKCKILLLSTLALITSIIVAQ